MLTKEAVLTVIDRDGHRAQQEPHTLGTVLVQTGLLYVEGSILLR